MIFHFRCNLWSRCRYLYFYTGCSNKNIAATPFNFPDMNNGEISTSLILEGLSCYCYYSCSLVHSVYWAIIMPLWRIKTLSNCCALLSDLTFQNKNPLINNNFCLATRIDPKRLKAYKERYLRSI